MFRKILIANRGEIAVRVTATCQALGIGAAVAYSDADADAFHVRRADEAYPIGPPPAAQSYLNIEAVVQAAERASAEALHPGYGFLAENPALAEACRDAGITFIGPPPESMRLLGSKVAARRLAEGTGVPIVPGYHGTAQDETTLLTEAERIGVPLLIKAAAGGGGRGMREVRRLDDFAEALVAARREARAAFGDDIVLLERLIENPRHIEFQIVGDEHGAMVHLGERECSVQRRHQKIIEEAPSPAVSPALRAEMGAAAVKVARAAGYTNAGTVEFMLASDGAYYFLEMNARLQVEHPITESVTGIDLVALQLHVAAGQPLPFAQDDISPQGHALECRIYAEDPAAGFLPSTGRLLVFELPFGPGVRADAGVVAGDVVTTHYDSLLAKLVASGESRGQALRRARWALRQCAVLGVTTNIEFLEKVIDHPAFETGDITTEFVTRHMAAALLSPPPTHEALLLAVFWQITAPAAGLNAPFDPWREASNWSLAATRTFELIADRESYVVEVTSGGVPRWIARIGDKQYDVAVARRHDLTSLTIRVDGRVIGGRVAQVEGAIHVSYKGAAWTVRPTAPPDVDAAAHHHAGAGGDAHRKPLEAPMPGTVLKIYVRTGERVEAHQRLMVLEAMKMEHNVDAPYDGVVSAIYRHEGDLVSAGERLVDIEDA